MSSNPSIAVGLTGASGAAYGLRLVECLVGSGEKVDVLISPPAQVVLATETDLELRGGFDAMAGTLTERFSARQGQLQVYGKDQWTAPMASGSNAPRAMVICPCTSGTLSAIAQGGSDSLMERAADVIIKENRQLILVHREMPLSAIHLENMLKLARLGVTIMPASPGFYHADVTVSSLIDFVVARILDHLGVSHTLLPRWGEKT